MRRLVALAAAGVLLAAAPAPASAAIITFESLAINDSGVHSVGSTYTEAGFTFSQPGSQPFPLSFFGTLESRFPGSTALFNNTIGGLTRLTQVGGAPFSLNSISLALLNGPGSAVVTFVGTHPDSTTVTQSFTVTNFGSETTFFFPSSFSNLAKVEWTQDFAFHQFDNVNVTPAPEPATLAVFGVLAVGALGARRRIRAAA